jgi:hypothetical protein
MVTTRTALKNTCYEGCAIQTEQAAGCKMKNGIFNLWHANVCGWKSVSNNIYSNGLNVRTDHVAINI